ncbi:hypothetical protein SLEP1_g12601 [Rubroshorea leprosula]|uniref:Uncharacterized protein n=1 Tax=Rubroshorea leprosula TaxID=152421 RepID=A0AAV5ID33_9ROSI|nr:hypothetical protein SLEP1_g12601 [Rubroshorea leprosula]
MNLVSSEPCAFVGSPHKCTASATSPDWVLGRDTKKDASGRSHAK